MKVNKDFSSERDIVNFLFERYIESGCYAAKFVSIPTFHKWGILDYLRTINHPMQPEIDILFYDPKRDKLHAVEVKFFRLTKRKRKSKTAEVLAELFGAHELMVFEERTPKQYYAGIDQALALLTYGVDFAWLFHVGLTVKEGKWIEKIVEFTPLGYMVIHEDVELLREPMENPLLAMKEIRQLRERLISSLKR